MKDKVKTKKPKKVLNKEISLKNLSLLHSLLKKHNIPYWLQDGTLLGLTRDKDLISHDNDTDIGLFFSDFKEKPWIIDEIAAHGFSLIRVLGEMDNSLLLTFVKDGEKVDFFFYYKNNNKVYHSSFTKFENQIVNYEYAPFNIKDITVKGFTFSVPENEVKFIETKYGSNWAVPDPKWKNITGPKNHVMTKNFASPEKNTKDFETWFGNRGIGNNNLSINLFINSPVTTPKRKKSHIERRIHLDAAMKHVPKRKNNHILEFGVFKAESINHIAQQYPEKTVYGFDSFEGLPEDWITTDEKNIDWPKGHFSVDNLPRVEKNVTLVKGWFNDTLPSWIKENKNYIDLLHIDCDLYSSTKYVLTELNELIIPGTVIIFDEMYDFGNPEKYSNWNEGEYKAFSEWLLENDRKFIPLYRSSYMQCSIKVTK